MSKGTWEQVNPSVSTFQNPQKETSEGFEGGSKECVWIEANGIAAVPKATFVAETTGPKQRGRPFQPGQSGNPTGRPKGTKNKLTDIFLNAVIADFSEHGAEVIANLRTRDPATYLRMVGALVPRELILQREEGPTIDYAELTDEEAVQLIEARRRRGIIEAALKAV